MSCELHSVFFVVVLSSTTTKGTSAKFDIALLRKPRNSLEWRLLRTEAGDTDRGGVERETVSVKRLTLFFANRAVKKPPAETCLAKQFEINYRGMRGTVNMLHLATEIRNLHSTKNCTPIFKSRPGGRAGNVS